MCISVQCMTLLVFTILSVRPVYLQQQEYTAVVIPQSYSECVEYVINPADPKYVIQTIQSRCLEGFISNNHKYNWTEKFDDDEVNYIRSLFRKVISEISDRDGDDLFQWRYRREVRDLPYSHWDNYARNVQRLKNEKLSREGRSKYDVIADIHGRSMTSAHGGPNILPWHRLYLIIFETALEAPIPYWDSTIDYEMDDPTKSILWSHRYFGNGFGYVKTGPFANFDTPVGKLFRNIGSDGSLFTHDGINNILSKHRFKQISEPHADDDASIEGQHNGVHIWVDGQMDNIQVSTYDPIFFTHHSFVDHIWEIFRALQKQRGIDPTTDTFEAPDDTVLQNFHDPTVGLPDFYNRDGYSDYIAYLVSYAPRAQCPFCSNSPNLYCDAKAYICVSRECDSTEYKGKPEEAKEAARAGEINSGGSKSSPFSIYHRDTRARMDSVTVDYDPKI